MKSIEEVRIFGYNMDIMSGATESPSRGNGGCMVNTAKFKDYGERIIKNCGRVILGKDEVIRQIVITYLCGGHVLLDDVPGTGKTMLFRAFSKTVGGDFKRIQFTPDLLPSDITGINFYNQKKSEFEFRRGPIFSSMVLADEINRATPRTQSALLECMEEHQVSVDGVTYSLPEPFMVMATQNPVESYGTFPLPEAQIDRFFMRLKMGYMTREEEMNVMSRRPTVDIIAELQCVIDPAETAELKKAYRDISVSDDVKGYIMDIVEATRSESRFTNGVSTRGARALYEACQVSAALDGRSFVIPEDVKREAAPVLAHRIASATDSRVDAESYLKELVESICVPLEKIR